MRKLFSFFGAFSLLALHCGGSAASDDDIAPDASPDSTLDAPASDATPTETSVNDSGGPDYCSIFTSHLNACGQTNACATAREGQCATEITFYSGQFLNAYVSCASKYECADAGVNGGQAFRQCVAQALSPDAVAQGLAQHVCASCVGSAQQTQCNQNFYSNTATALLEYDDAVLGDIDNACGAVDAGGGDAGTCIATFAACAATEARSILAPPPAACSDN